MKAIKTKGITLIALIITVIILLILAGTAISIAINGGDIFGKTSETRNKWNSAVASEESAIKNMVNYLMLDMPSEIKKGDIVNWTPTGHYTWDKNYYASYDGGTIYLYKSGESEATTLTGGGIVATKELYSVNSNDEEVASLNLKEIWGTGKENLDVTISEWRVLSVDKEKKEVILVPKTPSTPLILQGATGYNNSVKLLNDACRALYGGDKYGVEVHNINMDDIEGTSGRDPLIAETENGVIAAAKVAKNGYPAYGLTFTNNTGYTGSRDANGAHTSHVQYPTLYAEEAKRIITNSDDTTNISETGLGMSEARASFITKANEKVTKTTANSLVTKTVKTIQPTHTYYTLNNAKFTATLEAATKEGEMSNANILLPDGENTSYWVASRCIAPYIDWCHFMMRGVARGGLYGGTLFGSDSRMQGMALGLFPVVSITSGVLTNTETTGVFEYTPAD